MSQADYRDFITFEMKEEVIISVNDINRMLDEISRSLENNLKAVAPYDTGALHDSIKAFVQNQDDIIVSGLFYGAIQDKRQKQLGGKGWITKGVENADIYKVIGDHLRRQS